MKIALNPANPAFSLQLLLRISLYLTLGNWAPVQHALCRPHPIVRRAARRRISSLARMRRKNRHAGRSHYYVQRFAIKYNASLHLIMRHPLNSHFFILTIKHNATVTLRIVWPNSLRVDISLCFCISFKLEVCRFLVLAVKSGYCAVSLAAHAS